MAFRIANIEYFCKKCNKELGTNLSNSSLYPINIEWLCSAAVTVVNKIHPPNSTWHTQVLASNFSNVQKLVVDTALVDKVVAYLANFKHTCNCNCDCKSTSNCNCGPTNCGGSNCCQDCGLACNCGSNCWQCTCNCACDCNCNCVCNCECSDCSQYDCNCPQYSSNCTTRCVGNCNCVCACNCSAACHCLCGNGDCNCCFPYDTLVQLSDGSSKKIGELFVGEQIKTINGSTKVSYIETLHVDHYYKIVHEHGTVFVTEEHPFFLSNHTLKAIDPEAQPDLNHLLGVEKLEIGDLLLFNKEPSRILSIDFIKLDKAEDVYNLILEDDFSFFVEGVAVLTTSGFLYYFSNLFSDEEDTDIQNLDKVRTIVQAMSENELIIYQEFLQQFIEYYLPRIENNSSVDRKLLQKLFIKFNDFLTSEDITSNNIKNVCNSCIQIFKETIIKNDL